jgi:hypothetical protein
MRIEGTNRTVLSAHYGGFGEWGFDSNDGEVSVFVNMLAADAIEMALHILRAEGYRGKLIKQLELELCE